MLISTEDTSEKLLFELLASMYVSDAWSQKVPSKIEVQKLIKISGNK